MTTLEISTVTAPSLSQKSFWGAVAAGAELLDGVVAEDGVGISEDGSSTKTALAESVRSAHSSVGDVSREREGHFHNTRTAPF